MIPHLSRGPVRGGWSRALARARAAHARTLASAGAALAATLLAGCGAPAPEPPPERPLLVSDRSGAVRIYEADDDAGSITLIGAENARDPTWADTSPARLPDGRIVFASTRTGGTALFITTKGGLTARPLFSPTSGVILIGADAPADTDPAPGTPGRVLFARAATAGAPREIFIAALDGTSERPLTRSPADDGAPCLLPDRRTVVFISDRGGSPRLHTLDLEAPVPEKSVTAITIGTEGDEAIADAAPACLEDGSLMFARSVGGRPSQIMSLALAADPPVLRQITDAKVLPYGAGEPVPLENGRFLLTAGPGIGPDGRPRYGLYRMAAGGYNLTRITRDGAGYSDFARGLGLLR